MRRISVPLLLLCSALAAQPSGPGSSNPARGRSDCTTVAEFNLTLERGWALLQSGRHDELRRHVQKLLKSAEGLAPEHETLALAWLGFTYAELGRSADAERILIRCLELRERFWGGANQTDLNHARILTALAGVYVDLSSFQQAETRFEEAARIWRRIPGGRQDPRFAAFLHNAGMLRYGQGEYLEAERRLREAVSIFREFVPADDQMLARATAHLAASLSHLNRHDEAAVFSAQALSGFKLNQEPLIGSELLSIRALVLRRAKRGQEAKSVEALARDLHRQAEAQHLVDVSQLGTPRGQ